MRPLMVNQKVNVMTEDGQPINYDLTSIQPFAAHKSISIKAEKAFMSARNMKSISVAFAATPTTQWGRMRIVENVRNVLRDVKGPDNEINKYQCMRERCEMRACGRKLKINHFFSFLRPSCFRYIALIQPWYRIGREQFESSGAWERIFRRHLRAYLRSERNHQSECFWMDSR